MIDKTKRLMPTQVFWILFMAILMYMAVSFITGIWMGKTGIFICEFSLIIPVSLFLKKKRLPFFQVIQFKRVPIQYYLIGGLVILGFVIMMDEINRLIHDLVTMDETLLEGLRSLMIWDSWVELAMLILSMVIFAAIFEEMLFRGFVLGVLKDSFGPTIAIFASALSFTFLHFQPWYIMQFFLFGVIMGIVFWKSTSILPCVFLHAFHNVLVLLLNNSDSVYLQWYEFHGHVFPVWIAVSVVLIYVGIKKIISMTT
ncbi:CPBP family intramembrane metalloprotease [bacterium]|nr:CPBP family intramembrane metalloprotease [bacterium]